MCHAELGIKKVSKNRLMIQAVMEIFESANNPLFCMSGVVFLNYVKI
jgi:hypothetical protein